jgi:phage shock protein PspC (stress-responsive transcriptional regulator)
MKKAHSINLAGDIFNIDDDAYVVLDRYLEARRKEGGYMLASETEQKLSAFFKTLVKQVISYSDVENAIYQIGCPSGFNPKAPFNSGDFSYQNRIYRNTEHAVIGGVCYGMGEYFNIDPIVFRVILIAAFLGMGFGLLLYIILWIAIPRKPLLQ